MFNYGNRSSLRDFGDHGEVVRDAHFFGVGKIPTGVPNRLVHVLNERALASLAGEDGIAAVICPRELAEFVPDELGCIVSDNPAMAAFHIHSQLASREDYHWRSFDTRVASSAQVHSSAIVADRDVEIGADAVIEAGAVIQERTIIAPGCFVGANTVLGSKAFELVRIEGRNVLPPHVGGVRLGQGAMVLSATMVAKSVYAAFTELCAGSAVDNLVHVAHDVVVGENARVVACALLGGRVVLGAASYVGPNATVSNGLVVGADATVSLGSTATKDVESGQRVTGNFAIEHGRFLSNLKKSLS